MTVTETSPWVELGFLPPSLAIPDAEHPGLLRAGERAAAPYGGAGIETHACRATDLVQERGIETDLVGPGFDVVDLTPLHGLQTVLARVRQTRELSDEDAAAVRSGLDGAELRSAGGRTLKVLHLAAEGLILRTAGPNRMPVVPSSSDGGNDRGPATSVHADQDVFGTPLTQLMDGRAPSLFRHDSPDGHNHDASLMLVNIWIPLQQICQPLVLADGRSIDRRRHQLRYGLPTESFLDRDDDMAINDIWSFLHDPDQRWYFRSEMDHRSAWVFDTLSTAHGAGVLPGEDVAERCSRALAEAEEAAERGDPAALVEALSGAEPRVVPDGSTPALREAIGAMSTLVDEALADPSAASSPAGAEWIRRSREARGRLIRLSLELRLVASID